jgi:ComF family protein
LNLSASWHTTTQTLLDLLFPPRCVACERNTGWLCADCLNSIELVHPPICSLCGQATSSSRRCHSCRDRPLRIDGIRAVGYLEGALQTAIHRFKYSNIRPLVVPLSELASEYLRRSPLPVETIVPVPLHAARLSERGYNQAALLAEKIGSQVHMPIVDGKLLRVKSTIPQVGLNAQQRRYNVKGAFRCSDEALRGHSVLLVDDVCTTGATLEACSLALQDAKVKHVWGLVLARERYHSR